LQQEALTPDAVGQLQSLASQAKQIAQAAVQMQTSFGDAGDFKKVETEGKKSLDQVNAVLKKYDHPPVS
jgi:hypothetical protein